MAIVGQPLNPGYYWSGTRVCAGPGAPRYIGAVACWEYWRAPADVFAPASPYEPTPPPPPAAIPIDVPQPILIAPPPTTTGGSGSAPAPVAVPSPCGGCGGTGAAPTPTQPGAPVPTGPGPSAPPVTRVVSELRALPWWVYVLAVLVTAQVVKRA